jgi:hypothetical protein
MDDAGPKVRSGLQCEEEPIVKIEPSEDVKDISTTIDYFNNSGGSSLSLPSSSLWSYLIKTVRFVCVLNML